MLILFLNKPCVWTEGSNWDTQLIQNRRLTGAGDAATKQWRLDVWTLLPMLLQTHDGSMVKKNAHITGVFVDGKCGSINMAYIRIRRGKFHRSLGEFPSWPWWTCWTSDSSEVPLDWWDPGKNVTCCAKWPNVYQVYHVQCSFFWHWFLKQTRCTV